MQASDKPLRSDGEQARRRLLSAALVLFARHGYAQTSIRAIAEAAQTNVASISYYFGDKQGLYRASLKTRSSTPVLIRSAWTRPSWTCAPPSLCCCGAWWSH